MDIPLIVTEQYPERLGNTVKEIDIQHVTGIFSKTKFSMCDEILSKLNELDGQEKDKLEHVVLFGIEVSGWDNFLVTTILIDNI